MGKIEVSASKCLTAADIIKNNGSVILNPDGTVSVYQQSQYGLFPTQLTLECCRALDPNYYFDIDTQQCRYSKPKTCGFSPNEPINLMVNPVGDDGALFFLDSFETETCTLKINFDYLLKIKCEDLLNVANQTVTLNTQTSQTLAAIQTVQTQINITNVSIETLENQIELLNGTIMDTYYSIVCTTFPITAPIQLNSTAGAKASLVIPSASTESLSVFDNSAFSKKSTQNIDSTEKPSPTTTTSVIFCLTEPYGLQVWAQILGPTRYQAFLNGDPTSYTCNDVIQIATTNYPDIAILNCTTPFGTKTDLINQLIKLNNDLSSLNTTLTSLETTLINLENTFDTISVDGKCTNPVNALETFNIWMTLEIVNPDNTLTLVHEEPLFHIGTGNLYNYLTTGTTGLYLCETPSCIPLLVNSSNTTLTSPPIQNKCDTVFREILNKLWPTTSFNTSVPQNLNGFLESFPTNAFHSQWLHNTYEITNPSIISMITNKKIKIGIKIYNACVDFCFLMDNIHMDKTCVKVDRNDIIISQNPGFEFTRVIDNKKSWVDTQVPTNREFLIARSDNTHPIRQTDYDVNDERLVLNSKEIDLDISIASAIENDVWCFLSDNPCIITGCTDMLTIQNPFYDEMMEFPVNETPTSNPCSGYTLYFENYLNTRVVTTTKLTCGKYIQFYDHSPFGHIYDSYRYLTENVNGELGFYIKDYTNFANFSHVYSSQECCEGLATALQIYNDSAADEDKLVPFWDSVCQKCKVISHKCGDNTNFKALVTQPIASVSTIEGFENLITSELIDAKNRQTISSYPTLRALYDRYLNSSDYCDTISSGYNYQNMNQFAGLVGDYWVDLIEQVIPSTTIWGSVKIYTNTIFDEQKFKYKSYSTLLCKNDYVGQHVLSPINGTSGETASVSVDYTTLVNINDPKGDITPPRYTTCNTLHIAQMNSGSEFISFIPIKTGCLSTYLKECPLRVNIIEDNNILSIITIGSSGPFTYLWSNGAITPTITITSSGVYSVTVTDSKCCSATSSVTIQRKEYKQFQDNQFIDFMDGDNYEFMN